MSLVINNNIASLIAQKNLRFNTTSLTNSIEKLSSGYRINKASDDAAGLSISESLRSQMRGNSQAIGNIQDGVNLLQIAEGGLSVVTENIQRMRELCIQAANGTNGSTERSAIILEINARISDIDRIAKSTKFNNVFVLDGSITTNGKIQCGANSTISTNTIDLAPALEKCTTSYIGITLSDTGSTWSADNVRTYLNRLDNALNTIMTNRSKIGAYQNRLESTLKSLTIINENVTGAESRIRDLDLAKETANMTKNQILQQASANVLSKANSLPQLALSLLQG
ncbi:MAG: flagellin [Candidatus Gastranaerophilales bacterium]|nr:flagellin [Candidatus Gastranaerophilales bacterium]